MLCRDNFSNVGSMDKIFKILGIVSVYYPEIEELEANVISYLPYLDKLILWENTPAKDSRLHLLSIQNDKLEVRTTGKNEYLAFPFNQAIEEARKMGCTHFLTMDQDSRFEDGHFECYLDQIKKNEDPSIGVFGPNIVMRIPHVVYANPILPERIKYLPEGGVVTSGSVYRMELFHDGGFLEDFAVYFLDPYMCLKARKMGYTIVVCTDVLMNHRGYAMKSKNGLMVNNYPPLNTYYYIRNGILIWKIYPEYYTFRSKYQFFKYNVFFRIAKMIFETDRLSKLRALFLGLYHAFIGKTGPYDVK
ncbi:MAG: hypothetical protein H6Q17_184 [Bacteroidetes bacterium]|nr:hypothetical protein [Bacteroidota bacterium]